MLSRSSVRMGIVLSLGTAQIKLYPNLQEQSLILGRRDMGEIKLPCILWCAKTGSGQLHVQAMARSRFLLCNGLWWIHESEPGFCTAAKKCLCFCAESCCPLN